MNFNYLDISPNTNTYIFSSVFFMWFPGIIDEYFVYFDMEWNIIINQVNAKPKS